MASPGGSQENVLGAERPELWGSTAFEQREADSVDLHVAVARGRHGRFCLRMTELKYLLSTPFLCSVEKWSQPNDNSARRQQRPTTTRLSHGPHHLHLPPVPPPLITCRASCLLAVIGASLPGLVRGSRLSLAR